MVTAADNKVKEEKGEENDDEEEEDREGEEMGKKEEEGPCILRMMQRMIAAEVRNYIDNLRAENRPVIRTGLGLGLDSSFQK